jgi:hypothetical protein
LERINQFKLYELGRELRPLDIRKDSGREKIGEFDPQELVLLRLLEAQDTIENS